ncbi:MAG: type VI secretion system contractile sheath small subunit [Gammaproteobacteria bacterium]|nr:type VI secretion system contractile sheath small subunit [Gammaproteobacteria bacterium]
MSKDGSVAPKERVNIVYKPATGDAQQEVELPLKLMMLGDYTLKADDTLVEDRKPINIDKDNFTDVMKNQKLSLDINVANKLSTEEGEEMSVNLKFESLKDFEPESVLKQVPELNQMLELREALVALKGPLGNVPAFRKMIEQALQDEGDKEKLLKELKIEAPGES